MNPNERAAAAESDARSVKLIPAVTDTSAETIILRAIDKNVSVEALERLLDMRRELKAEYAKKAYFEALAAFQAECPIIKKTKAVRCKSGTIGYRYAPIESIVAQIKDILQKHGFSYTTSMELTEKGVKAVCRVTHSGGHSEVSEMEVPLGTKTDLMSQSQVVAAAQTFAKRYAFCNAFGIMTMDEDNDAIATDGQKIAVKEQVPLFDILSSQLDEIALTRDSHQIREWVRMSANKIKTCSKEERAALRSAYNKAMGLAKQIEK